MNRIYFGFILQDYEFKIEGIKVATKYICDVNILIFWLIT